MTTISINTPCYFFTCVTHKRLPIFQTEKMKQVLLAALDQARSSSGMLYFAYVIMLDHLHILTDGKRSPSDSLRFINGVSAKYILDHLKQNELTSSLEKLRQFKKKDGSQYSVWEHHSDKFLMTSGPMFMQKMHYIHNNPVKEGLVDNALDYKYSSARIWAGKPLDDEPLEMDIKEIRWRKS